MFDQNGRIPAGKSGPVLRLAIAVVLLLAVTSGLRSTPQHGAEDVGFPPEFFVSHLPKDFNTFGGGFPKGKISDAAVYAWLSFVALHFPAAKNKRDVQDDSGGLGAPSERRVWDTYRARVEVYPGSGKPFDTDADDYGYDEPPRYIYDPKLVGLHPGLRPGEVAACPGVDPNEPVPMHNLDEPNHNDVRSGLSPAAPYPGQQILLESKTNRQEYVYVVSRGWYGGDSSLRDAEKRTAAYIKANLETPPVPKKANNPADTEFVVLPVHTVEIKAAWRRLGRYDDPSKFLVRRVRYYKTVNGLPCYMNSSLTDPNDRWGLIAMHIMHKTPSAPYFTWATFEHSSTLVGPEVGADGTPVAVEGVDGGLTEVGRKFAAKFSRDLSWDPSHPGQPLFFGNSAAAGADRPSLELYYHQRAKGDAPDVKYIGVHRRMNDIPEEIVATNRAAQNSIRRIAPGLPLVNYRLVSTQWVPIGKDRAGVPYSGTHAGGTYYASNVIIEAPPTHQMFSGRFVQGGPRISDFPAPTAASATATSDGNLFNVVFEGKGHLAGGCMGCHGQMQSYGSDWSFLVDRQRVLQPEIRPE